MPIKSLLTWGGILLCLSQSGMFSGLNLAFFGISRLRLEVMAAGGNARAKRILELRKDSNFLLSTILWGNVGINVLLTLLSDSVLAGVSAFLFSTVAITFMGEIVPQAYFSRHALRMASSLEPVLRFYQFMLYPVARPSALILNWWLGPEGIQLFLEKDMRQVISRHMQESGSEIGLVEGMGALNFLAIDDLLVVDEGEQIDGRGVVSLEFVDGKPVFPDFKAEGDDPFLKRIASSGRKWVVLTDQEGKPRLVLDSDSYLREVLLYNECLAPDKHFHRPIIVRNLALSLGEVVLRLNTHGRSPDGEIIEDVVLVWGAERRIITGADILGRLLIGIVRHEEMADHAV